MTSCSDAGGLAAFSYSVCAGMRRRALRRRARTPRRSAARRGSCRRSCTSGRRVHAFFCIRMFRIRSGVVDGQARVGVSVGGDVGDRAVGCRSRPGPVASTFCCHGWAANCALQPPPPAPWPSLTPAALAAVVPDASRRPIAARAEHQARPADGHHVRRGRREARRSAVAVLRASSSSRRRRRRRDHDAGMVERGAVRHAFASPSDRIRGRPTSSRSRRRRGRPRRPRRPRGPARRVRVASTSRMWQFWQIAWAVSMSSEISTVQPSASSTCSSFFGFAVLRARLSSSGSPVLRERQVAGFAVLVDLLEAAVRGRACRQAEFFVVGLRGRSSARRVVVGVHQRDRLSRRGRLVR